jgi:hypothetical protein
VEFAVDGGGLEVNTASPHIQDKTAKAILSLLDALIEKMDTQFDNFVKQHCLSLSKERGVFVLQTDANASEWVIRRHP